MSRSFLSLFAGAGGLDHGLMAAGWRCRYASDIDPAAVATLRLNVKNDGPIEEADVTELTGSELLARAGARRGDIPLLVGGPPCQSWSSAGHQKGWDDPRGRLFQDFIRLADEADVGCVLFENVRGLITARGPDGQPGSALEHIRRQLLSRGFVTSLVLLNAADYGVPQRRVRLFVLGHRDGETPLLPVQTHSKTGLAGLRPWATLGQCLASIEPPLPDEIIRPSGKLAAELEHVAAGSGVRSGGKVEQTRPGGHWGYKQGAFVADLSLPARTVTASAQQDWIRDPNIGLRKLTPRECSALQSFPSNWRWPDQATSSTLYRLIGNAVPPRLAQAVGHALGFAAVRRKGARAELAVLPPLPRELAAAVAYTVREERTNGDSRRAAPPRRRGGAGATG